MKVINGKEIARQIIEDLKNKNRPDKILAAILIGENSQSKSFLRQKELMTKELGITFELFQFGEEILEDDLIKKIQRIGADEEIGGMIVQLPLPPHFNRDRILAAVNPKKDVDALTRESKELVNPLPVEVVKDILQFTNYKKLQNITIAVVGKGFLVGKPIIEWLKKENHQPMIFDSKSDLKDLKKADLIITGVGKGGLIKPEMLKAEAGVIDFGYSFKSEKGKVESKIRGDFDASNVNSQMSNVVFYTPTPGGTGPILVAEIFKNFYKLNPPT